MRQLQLSLAVEAEPDLVSAAWERATRKELIARMADAIAAAFEAERRRSHEPDERQKQDPPRAAGP